MMKDPVCGMRVDEKKAPTSRHDGKQYAFCGKDCKEAFDRDPTRYTTSAESEKAGKA
jgi:YHS domain-containing protein